MIILNAVTKKDMSIEEVQKLIADVDQDGGGEIDEDEFLALMKEQMKDTQQDEELIAAFKLFGAKDHEDHINFETLQFYLREEENETFSDEDLEMLYSEIAGASNKPMNSSNDPGSLRQLEEDSAQKNKGISFKDFMLMMMAK